MAESGMRSKLVEVLRSLDAVAVENPAFPGTPDVNYVEGWIELKWLREWPRMNGVVTFDHYTQQQRVWAIRRRSKNGRCYMMIQCKKEWILLDGRKAAEIVNFTTRLELIEAAIKYWPNGLNKEELIECLTT